jgi:regulatory protein
MKGQRGRNDAPSPLDAQALRSKAIRLLARRERSRAELLQRLIPYCEDPAQLDPLLDELQARGWLSEARLAAQFVQSRRARAGALRIRQELAARGVQADTIAESTAGLEAGDLAAALALWRRRFGAPAADRAGRERQLRFLVSRGFARGIALEVLRIGAGEDAAEPGA